MMKLVQLISWLSLGLIVVAPSLFYVESITLETSKLLMTIATFFGSPLRSAGWGDEPERSMMFVGIIQ